jgi:hypothetical protein
MEFWQKFLAMDRRIIYILISLSVIIPLLIHIGLPTVVTPPVQRVFDAIEAVPPNDKPLLIACDYSPSTMPELHPMAEALLRHCFAREIRVILYGGLYPQGVGVAQIALNEVTQDFPNAVNGEDYVFLGYVPGLSAVVLSMGEDIHRTFTQDYYGEDLANHPMMKEVRNYDDIPLLIDLSGGPVPRTWVNYAGARYGQEIAIGTTAVSAAEWYAFLQTGQFMGMLGGMKGAAEYEALLERNGLYKGRKPASIGMDAQTISHVLIILLIVLGNVGFFVTRKKKA